MTGLAAVRRLELALAGLVATAALLMLVVAETVSYAVTISQYRRGWHG